jgi:hypothetical protein
LIILSDSRGLTGATYDDPHFAQRQYMPKSRCDPMPVDQHAINERQSNTLRGDHSLICAVAHMAQ